MYIYHTSSELYFYGFPLYRAFTIDPGRVDDELGAKPPCVSTVDQQACLVEMLGTKMKHIQIIIYKKRQMKLF